MIRSQVLPILLSVVTLGKIVFFFANFVNNFIFLLFLATCYTCYTCNEISSIENDSGCDNFNSSSDSVRTTKCDTENVTNVGCLNFKAQNQCKYTIIQ